MFSGEQNGRRSRTQSEGAAPLGSPYRGDSRRGSHNGSRYEHSSEKDNSSWNRRASRKEIAYPRYGDGGAGGDAYVRHSARAAHAHAGMEDEPYAEYVDSDYYDEHGTYGEGKAARAAAVVHPPLSYAPSRDPQKSDPRRWRVAPTHSDPAARIKFVHVQGDDILIELSGVRVYVLELKTRNADIVIDAHHPCCVSMSPFKAHVHLPHAEDRLLGVRLRALPTVEHSVSGHDEIAEPTQYEWTAWHTVGECRFKGGDDAYSAPHYQINGRFEPGAHTITPTFWSGGSSWKPEAYGGGEPFLEADGSAGGDAGTPGPGTYGLPAFLQFGGGVADGRGYDYTPSSAFASNSRRFDARTQADDLWRTATPKDQAATGPRTARKGDPIHRTFHLYGGLVGSVMTRTSRREERLR